MAVDSKSRLKEIIDSYLDKDGGVGIDTGIVAGHFSSDEMFGIRQGVEFFPGQDNFGNQRKDFLDRVVKYNQLDTRLDSIWDYFFVMDKVCFISALRKITIVFIISAPTNIVPFTT
jgi:hypothetical protein